MSRRRSLAAAIASPGFAETSFKAFYMWFYVLLLLLLLLLNQVVTGAFCAFVAGEKNRSPTNWFWLGFCFGPFPIAMLALAALPTLATRPTWMDDRTHPTDRALATRPTRDFGLQPRSPENIVLNWVEIEPGNFCMGDGRRAVAVTLTSPFRLGQTQVTMLQWVCVMGTEPWANQRSVKIGDDNAASYVDWHEATEFCRRLTDTDHKNGKLPAAESYRLPTEAEWEYACRAGTTTAYSFGDDESQLGEFGWFSGNTARGKYAQKVSLKKPNPWGLYDMHGNVWEWCSDSYGEKLFGGTDPLGPERGSGRVIRGGGWRNYSGYCRSAYRYYGCDPSFRSDSLGFRVARSQSAQ